MEELIAKLNAFWKAAEEFDNVAAEVAGSKRTKKLTCKEKELLTAKALDAQIKGARGERSILAVQMIHVCRDKKTLNSKR